MFQQPDGRFYPLLQAGHGALAEDGGGLVAFKIPFI
jgi:hypothetical protein